MKTVEFDLIENDGVEIIYIDETIIDIVLMLKWTTIMRVIDRKTIPLTIE